jgi:hypothetical protein
MQVALYARVSTSQQEKTGFDHGAGHSLLRLYGAKAPEGKKSM